VPTAISAASDIIVTTASFKDAKNFSNFLTALENSLFIRVCRQEIFDFSIQAVVSLIS